MTHVTVAPGIPQDFLDRMDECAITVDADWRILAANPAAARLLGPTAGGALVGKDLRQLLPPALLPALDRSMTTRMRTESTDRRKPGAANADDDCWLEVQPWALLCGAADTTQARALLDVIDAGHRAGSPLGSRLRWPPVPEAGVSRSLQSEEADWSRPSRPFSPPETRRVTV